MKSKYILPIFLVLQIILLQIISYFPDWIENYYSNGFYPFISKNSRLFLGNIPISVGDCIYLVLIFLILKWFWKQRKTWRENWKNNLLSIVSSLSVFYFMFHLLWGFNYYRQPLFDKMQIQRDYSNADLVAFTKKLILKTNTIQFQITKNDSLKVVFPYSQETVFKMNLNGFKNLSKTHSFFDFQKLSSKKSIISLPLTYMGFSGYLNPFTNESQVNYLMPMYNFPIVASHEMAHQMGFASESECNFIGFLAAIKNDDLYVKYSGYSFALRYCLGNLQMQDETIFKRLLKTINPGILKNYKESEAFWDKYQTPIETAFYAFYDHFLKANQQNEGMDSYSKFLNLLINYKEPF